MTFVLASVKPNCVNGRTEHVAKLVWLLSLNELGWEQSFEKLEFELLKPIQMLLTMGGRNEAWPSPLIASDVRTRDEFDAWNRANPLGLLEENGNTLTAERDEMDETPVERLKIIELLKLRPLTINNVFMRVELDNEVPVFVGPKDILDEGATNNANLMITVTCKLFKFV